MTTTRFLWNPINQNIIREYDGAGNTAACYTTEPELYGDVVSQRRSGQDSVYHYDGQGSTLALTDAAGNVTDTYAYTAFGEVTEHAGSTVNPFQYIGRKGYYFDGDSGACEVRQRPYVAGQRWLAKDLLSGVTIYSTNAYVYALNNPVVHTDASGLFPPMDDTVEIPPIELYWGEPLPPWNPKLDLCYKLPCNSLDWSPNLCADQLPGGHLCPCESTRSGAKATEGDCTAALANAVAKAAFRPGDSVVLAKFYCSRDCHGTSYGLTCWDRITHGRNKGKAWVGVCIPFGGVSKCRLEALIAHELLHVLDVLEYIDELGFDALRLIDRDAFEERAYNRQCGILAAQKCLTGDEADRDRTQCVSELKRLSTSQTGIFTIGLGCGGFQLRLPP